MFKTLSRTAILGLVLSSFCSSGCSDDKEGVIVGGPSEDIQAQIQARDKSYGQSMQKAAGK